MAKDDTARLCTRCGGPGVESGFSGSVLRLLRRQAGLTLVEVAELAKVTPMALSKIERGEISSPSRQITLVYQRLCTSAKAGAASRRQRRKAKTKRDPASPDPAYHRPPDRR